MTRHWYPTPRGAIGRLRPSPASIAAAASVYDPGLLLQLHAAQRGRGRSARPPADAITPSALDRPRLPGDRPSVIPGSGGQPHA